MHGLVAAFRGFDGANGLRPTRVWLGRRFDKAVARRSAPAGNMILVADELANLFHLPIDIAGFESAPTRPFSRAPAEWRRKCHLSARGRTPYACQDFRRRRQASHPCSGADRSR